MASTSRSRLAREIRTTRAIVGAMLVLSPIVAGCGGSGSDGAGDAVRAGGSVSAAPTSDPAAAGRRLARQGRYATAVAAYEAAGLDGDADRVRRRGARALTRSAQRALARGRYASARRLAQQSRRLRRTAAARTVLDTADTRIAAAEAAERERRRLARIARDTRTCSSAEKGTVRGGDGIPAGCETYAAELAARREASDTGARDDCDSNYEGACLKPDSADYDCAGGSGNGPDYTGPVQSVGSDPYDLDRDGDGLACETS